MNYYNDNDKYSCAWLRELIKEKFIPQGEVDCRSIVDVRPDDLKGFLQCHFFAGIGGWAYALKLAGCPETKPVWTGSCPCQPFSIGNVWDGGGKGMLDEVFSDLEAINYACGSAILPANAFGKDHERKRLFWLADASGERWERHQPIECVSVATPPPLAVNGDTITGVRRAMACNYSGLLPCDGLSVQLERDALKGYGNAIVPQVAAEFIKSYLAITDYIYDQPNN